jgi:hypothetical protein
MKKVIRMERWANRSGGVSHRAQLPLATWHYRSHALTIIVRLTADWVLGSDEKRIWLSGARQPTFPPPRGCARKDDDARVSAQLPRSRESRVGIVPGSGGAAASWKGAAEFPPGDNNTPLSAG